jgi:hypothetical protein
LHGVRLVQSCFPGVFEGSLEEDRPFTLRVAHRASERLFRRPGRWLPGLLLFPLDLFSDLLPDGLKLALPLPVPPAPRALVALAVRPWLVEGEAVSEPVGRGEDFFKVAVVGDGSGAMSSTP